MAMRHGRLKFPEIILIKTNYDFGWDFSQTLLNTKLIRIFIINYSWIYPRVRNREHGLTFKGLTSNSCPLSLNSSMTLSK